MKEIKKINGDFSFLLAVLKRHEFWGPYDGEYEEYFLVIYDAV